MRPVRVYADTSVFGGLFDVEFHFDKIPMYNGVNRAMGYGEIAVHSPQEVIDYEASEDGQDF